jgi:hypothetical protein
MPGVTKKGTPGSKLLQDPRFLLVATALAMAVLVGLPVYQDTRNALDPAGEAQTAYISFLMQIKSEEKNPIPVPGMANPPERIETDLPLSRDMFAPGRPKPPPRASTQAVRVRRPARPSIPKIGGIFIDGSSRRAIVNGRIVTENEEIQGYRVLQIERSWVRLGRGDTVVRLELGGKQ